MVDEIIVDVARDFSPTPGARYRTDGPFSGEAFRTEVLTPRVLRAFESGTVVVVRLDGAIGFPSSFLEEAFGGLARSGKVPAHELPRLIRVESSVHRNAARLIPDFIKAAIDRLRTRDQGA